MKSDTERKKYYTEKLHKRKNRMHVHLSKPLKAKLKTKARALLVRKGDTVKILRGSNRGKEAKISEVNTIRRKLFLEGITVKNARGTEVAVPMECSNLLLISLEPTKERTQMFDVSAFKSEDKAEKKTQEAKSEPSPSSPPTNASSAKEANPKQLETRNKVHASTSAQVQQSHTKSGARTD